MYTTGLVEVMQLYLTKNDRYELSGDVVNKSVGFLCHQNNISLIPSDSTLDNQTSIASHPHLHNLYWSQCLPPDMKAIVYKYVSRQCLFLKCQCSLSAAFFCAYPCVWRQ